MLRYHWKYDLKMKFKMSHVWNNYNVFYDAESYL